MKKQNFKGLVIVAATGSLIASCDLVKDLEYKATPNPLEMHGDSVRVKIDVTFPEKAIKAKAKAEITPMLGSTPLKTVSVLGEKATGNGTTIKYKPGGKITYTDVVAYKADMEATDLTVSGKVFKGEKAKEKQDFGPIKVADATIITPYLVNKDFKVVYEKDNFKRVIEHTTTAQINYDKAQSVVKAAELKDTDIKELENWLKEAQNNPKINIKTIEVVGYASPEGEEDKNKTLSTNRSETAKKALDGITKRSKNEKAQSDIYKLSSKGEDWEGFKAELKKSAMNEDEKALVLRVLEMEKDETKREQEIKNMAKTFVYVEKNVLPKQRRSEIHVIYDLEGYSDAEMIALSKSDIAKLNVEEVLYTANLSADLNEKARIYAEAEKLFPNDARVYANHGVVLYNQNKLADAKVKFEKAAQLNNNGIANNNLAALAGSNGDIKTMKTFLAKGKDAGAEAKYNQGIIDIMEGKYSSAVSNLGEKNYNKALATLLNGNPNDAINVINQSDDKDSAKGLYLKAIGYARQNELSKTIENLNAAFAKDSSLKAKAAQDREFVRYFDEVTFSNLVK